MGYTLEIYALSYDALTANLNDATVLEELPQASDLTIEAWHHGKAALLDGDLNDDAAAVLASLIRHAGRPLVSLEHASRSGIEFRDAVSEQLAVAGAVALNRSIEGLHRDDLPWFGWIRHNELSASPVFEANVGADLDTTGWKADIARAIDFARERRADIVLIYT